LKISNRGQRWLAATLVIGGVFSAIQIYRAQAQSKPAQLIATVDTLRVLSPEWLRFKTEEDALHQKGETYASILQPFLAAQSAAAPPLDTTTLGSWIKLREQVALNPGQETDQNKKDLASYESQAKTATDSFNALVNKGDKLTDADKADLAKLQDLQQKGNALVVNQFKEYQTTINDDVKATQDKLAALSQDAITKVAQQDNVTYVFNASVVSQELGLQKILLYSSDKNVDITDQVLKTLNK